METQLYVTGWPKANAVGSRTDDPGPCTWRVLFLRFVWGVNQLFTGFYSYRDEFGELLQPGNPFYELRGKQIFKTTFGVKSILT